MTCCKANFDAREFGFLNKIHETYSIVSKTLHSSIRLSIKDERSEASSPRNNENCKCPSDCPLSLFRQHSKHFCFPHFFGRGVARDTKGAIRDRIEGQ